MEDTLQNRGFMIEKVRENRTMLLLIIVAAVFLFLKYVSPLVAPALFALLFVSLCYPMFERVYKKTHIKHGIQATIFLLFLGLLLITFFWAIGLILMQYVPHWIKGMDVVETQFCHFVSGCCEFIETRFGGDAVKMEDMILDRVTVFIDYIQMNFLPGMLDETWSYAKNLASIGGFFVVMIIATILLAKDYGDMLTKIKKTNEFSWVLEIIEGVISYIKTFCKAQLLIMFFISLVSALTLGLSGISGGILWGILAGILDVLPFIGTGIVLIPLGAWQLMNQAYGKAIACFILYGICALIRECMEPRLIGKRIGVYPIAILISVYAGVKLFGIAGILKGPLAFILIYQTYLSLTKAKD